MTVHCPFVQLLDVFLLLFWLAMGSKSLYSLSSKSLSGEAEFIRGMTIAGGDDVEGGRLSSSSLSSAEFFVCYFLPQVMSTKYPSLTLDLLRST